MATNSRTATLAAAAGLARAAALAPDWRALFSAALAREVAERRFFLWLPVAAMGGVALNLAADREPSLALSLVLTALFIGLAALCRKRPVALGAALGVAALLAGFSSMGLRTARVAAPVLDHIRIVKLEGFVEELDLRPVGARLIVAVAKAADMPADKSRRAASG